MPVTTAARTIDMRCLPAALLLSTMACAPPDSESPTAYEDANRAAERRRMVTDQIEAHGIRDPLVLRAMELVPRHDFVPPNVRHLAYADRALPIGHEQTISQPYIVALMTEAAALGPDSRVLEVGTGSGYQAAVLASITPHVFSIEIVDALARRATAALARGGYDVRTRTGDGYRGWPEHAPFDAILVTAAPDHMPPALFEQLAPGGRMCIPVGDVSSFQELRLITKTTDGRMLEEMITAVRFVPMTGEAERR